MTRDELIRMARESGWQYADGDDGYDPLWRFAALVAAAEREAIIRLIDEMRHIDRDGVIDAIRARGGNMTDREAMQMALDALESLQAWPETPENFKRFRAIEALRARLAQPDVPESCFGETEPVAWVSDREARMVWWNDKFTHISQAPPRNTPLYTAPPQREWVGLTHKEHMEIMTGTMTTSSRMAAVEAKLKEKNT